MAENVIVLNRGPRTFDLKNGPNGEKRTLAPGSSIETLDNAEAKFLLGFFREIQDAAKVVPASANKVAELHAKIAKLEAENKGLMEKHAVSIDAPKEEVAVKKPEAVPSRKKVK